MLVRGIEEDVLPTVQRHGMGTLTHSPLAGGWLSGRWRKTPCPAPSRPRPPARFNMSSPGNQRKLEAVEELALLAEQSDLTLIELAVAFVISHPGVTSAIIGPRTKEQLEAFLPAADHLPADQSAGRGRFRPTAPLDYWEGVDTWPPATNNDRRRPGPRLGASIPSEVQA